MPKQKVKPARSTSRKTATAPAPPETRKVYMCGIDWQDEHWAWYEGYVIDAPEIFRSVKELKAKRSCWPQCGIVEIEMRVTGWPVKQNLDWNEPKAKARKKAKPSRRSPRT